VRWILHYTRLISLRVATVRGTKGRLWYLKSSLLLSPWTGVARFWGSRAGCAVYRSRVHHSVLHELLKKLEPPLGFGRKCPNRLAYRVSCRISLTTVTRLSMTGSKLRIRNRLPPPSRNSRFPIMIAELIFTYLSLLKPHNFLLKYFAENQYVNVNSTSTVTCIQNLLSTCI